MRTENLNLLVHSLLEAGEDFSARTIPMRAALFADPSLFEDDDGNAHTPSDEEVVAVAKDWLGLNVGQAKKMLMMPESISREDAIKALVHLQITGKSALPG